ncbi:hypothetical protein ACFOYU_15425 [Microvirga sp. GCM10011540]|uniref:hypothetical protein n=1 Tax=Microvirga sp. GCM10011540 TaxID=3317338 RepID=UPI003611A2D0
MAEVQCMLLGAAATLLVVMLIDASSTSLGHRHWVQYWSSVNPISILVALAAGATGAAIIAAQRSVLTAGVMIALAGGLVFLLKRQSLHRNGGSARASGPL